MTREERHLELDAQLVILGLGYATTLLVAIGWLVTLVT